MSKRRASVLECDDVIAIDYGYIHKREPRQFVGGIFEMTRAFAQRGYARVVATNQLGAGTRILYGTTRPAPAITEDFLCVASLAEVTDLLAHGTNQAV
jgi:hypothetical protein